MERAVGKNEQLESPKLESFGVCWKVPSKLELSNFSFFPIALSNYIYPRRFHIWDRTKSDRNILSTNRSRIISLAVNETLKFDWVVILLTVGGFLLGLISFCCFVSFQHVKLHNPESIRKLTLRDSMSSRRQTTSVTPRDSVVKKRFEDLCEEIV